MQEQERARFDERRERAEHVLDLQQQPVLEPQPDDVIAGADRLEGEQPQEPINVGQVAVAQVVAELVP